MKLTLPFLFLFSLLFIASVTNAQHRACATQEVHEKLMKENAEYRKSYEEYERQEHERSMHKTEATQAVVTIPVVIHVLYNNTTENISDAQILTQLDVLNADFAKTNADVSNTPALFSSLAANTNIQFCLAKRDPSGNPTTGITRTYTDVASFVATDGSDLMKFDDTGGHDIWDRSKYLNIWVCDLSGGILGYAQFPGGTANTDGVVIDYMYFGTTGTATAPYNLGRTATHEVGHWLNLRHIWGDANCGNDLVSDTPTQEDANGGCPSFPHSTCSNTSDMFMNYMDYTNDACMYMFTTGQSTRMNTALGTASRSGLATSNGCTPVSTLCTGTTTFDYKGATFTDGSGSANYGNNSDCKWLIQPTGATAITLSFNSFNIESANDQFIVYDGATTASPVLGTFSGSSLPSNIVSTGGSMLIHFTSNGSVTSSGWSVTYISNATGSTGAGCSGTTSYTASSGTVTDGSGSNDYADDLDCKFLIQPAGGVQSITIQFTAFDIEDGYDYLYVYDGATTGASPLGTFTGTTIPSNITSSGGSLLLRFVSDESLNESGWSLNYSTTNGVSSSAASDAFAKISPNPAKEVLTVDGNLSDVTSVKVMTMLGTLVYQDDAVSVSGSLQINVADLSTGVYYLMLESRDGRKYAYRFVKE